MCPQFSTWEFHSNIHRPKPRCRIIHILSINIHPNICQVIQKFYCRSNCLHYFSIDDWNNFSNVIGFLAEDERSTQKGYVREKNWVIIKQLSITFTSTPSFTLIFLSQCAFTGNIYIDRMNETKVIWRTEKYRGIFTFLIHQIIQTSAITIILKWTHF